MKRILFVMMILGIALLAGCGANTRPDENYRLQLEMVQKISEATIAAEERRDARLQQVLEACQGNADCVEKVGMYSVMNTMAAKSGGGGNGNALSVPTYQRKETFMEKAGLMVMSQMLPSFVSMRQSDNMTKSSIAQINANAQTTTALYGMLDNFVNNVQPNINITGGAGSGIGTTYNSADTNTTGDGNAVGDGSVADNSRGQVNGDGNFNSGRIGSPGPWTNSNNGGECPGGDGGGGGDGAGGNGATGGNCSGGGRGD